MTRCAYEPCNRAFTSKRADARYCSAACRARASRERGVVSADVPPAAPPPPPPVAPAAPHPHPRPEPPQTDLPGLTRLEGELADLRRAISAIDPVAITQRAAEAARTATAPARDAPGVQPAELARVREVAESARLTADSARMAADGARMAADGARGTAEAADRRILGSETRLTQLLGRIDAAEASLVQLRAKVEESGRAQAGIEGRLAQLEVASGLHRQAINVLDDRVQELDRMGGEAIQLFASTMR